MFSFPSKPYRSWRQAVLNAGRRPERYDEKTWEKKWKEIVRKNQMAFLGFWSIFIDERQDIGRYGMHPAEDRFNYLCLFHLNNYARFLQFVRRSQIAKTVNQYLSADQRMRVFDIGAGTGVASQAFLYDVFASNPELMKRTKVVLVDKRKHGLESAGEMLKGQWPELLVTNVKEDVRDFVPRPAGERDLSVGLFSYVANELFTTSNRFNETKLLSMFGFYDIVILLDSAEEKQAKTFMAFRNSMVEAGWMSVFPCPHQLTCPLVRKASTAGHESSESETNTLEDEEQLPEMAEESFSAESVTDTRKMIKDRCFSEFEDVDLFELRSIAQTLKLERSHLSASAYIYYSPRFLKRLKDVDPLLVHGEKKPILVGKPIVELDEGVFVKHMTCDPSGQISEQLVRKGSRGFSYRGDHFVIE